MTDALRTAIDAASAYLTDRPEEARYTDSVARARVQSGLRVRVDGPAGELLDTDMPAAVGGAASAPSPGWFLRAAVAACVASLATMRAAQLGKMEEIAVWAVDHCPVSDAVRRGVPVHIEVVEA